MNFIKKLFGKRKKKDEQVKTVKAIPKKSLFEDKPINMTVKKPKTKSINVVTNSANNTTYQRLETATGSALLFPQTESTPKTTIYNQENCEPSTRVTTYSNSCSNTTTHSSHHTSHDSDSSSSSSYDSDSSSSNFDSSSGW